MINIVVEDGGMLTATIPMIHLNPSTNIETGRSPLLKVLFESKVLSENYFLLGTLKGNPVSRGKSVHTFFSPETLPRFVWLMAKETNGGLWTMAKEL